MHPHRSSLRRFYAGSQLPLLAHCSSFWFLYIKFHPFTFTIFDDPAVQAMGITISMGLSEFSGHTPYVSPKELFYNYRRPCTPVSDRTSALVVQLACAGTEKSSAVPPLQKSSTRLVAPVYPRRSFNL